MAFSQLVCLFPVQPRKQPRWHSIFEADCQCHIFVFKNPSSDIDRRCGTLLFRGQGHGRMFQNNVSPQTKITNSMAVSVSTSYNIIIRSSWGTFECTSVGPISIVELLADKTDNVEMKTSFHKVDMFSPRLPPPNYHSPCLSHNSVINFTLSGPHQCCNWYYLN